MKTKKAWLRITEAVIAITIFAGILLMVSLKNKNTEDISETIYEIQKRALNDIAFNSDLRNEVLDYDTSEESVNGNKAPADIVNSVKNSLSQSGNLEFRVVICPVEEVICNMQNAIEKDVYVADRVISTNIDTKEFAPKKIRLFVWLKG